MVLFQLKASLVLACLLGAVGCRGGENQSALYAEAARDDPRKRPYVIGAADVVRVSVWKDASLSTSAIVRPDGIITLPLVGEVEAAGHTVSALQQRISTRLATFAKDAVVTVSLDEINSYHFTVTGSVASPGMFTPRYFVTVSEAVALAGGPTRYANTGEMVLVRAVGGRPLTLRVDYDGILSGKAAEQDIVLLAGDALRVP
jgi:polysaccharide export outer membrane protein